METSVSRKNGADVGMKPVSASVLQKTLQVCRIGIMLTMVPRSGEGLQTQSEHRVWWREEHKKKNEYRNKQLSTLIVNIEMDVPA